MTTLELHLIKTIIWAVFTLIQTILFAVFTWYTTKAAKKYLKEKKNKSINRRNYVLTLNSEDDE